PPTWGRAIRARARSSASLRSTRRASPQCSSVLVLFATFLGRSQVFPGRAFQRLFGLDGGFLHVRGVLRRLLGGLVVAARGGPAPFAFVLQLGIGGALLRVSGHRCLLRMEHREASAMPTTPSAVNLALVLRTGDGPRGPPRSERAGREHR